MENNSMDTLLGGFEAIFEGPGSIKEPKDIIIEKDDDTVDLAAEDFDENEIPSKVNKKEIEEEDIDTEETEEEVEEEEKETKPTKQTKSVKKSEVKEEDEEETEVESNDDENQETNLVTGLFDAISEQLGIELEEGEEKPKTAEDIVKYFQDIINENSVPTYANEQTKALDEFVRNGGKLEDFYKVDSELDVNKIDTEDEIDQKKIVTAFLKEKGLSDAQIERKLTKYEDAGILEDEAEDALEAMKEIVVQKKEQLLEQQKNEAEATKVRQQKFYTSVVDEIKGMANIRGIKIPEADKKVLLEYIFKPDASGMTKYQKDYAKNVKNLIESAYFTMKGDTLLSAAKNEGSKNAIKNFKNSLRTAPVTKTRKIVSDPNKTSIWDTVAQQLTTKK